MGAGRPSREPTGIYVHVPFCSAKCRYCDFLSAPGSRREMEDHLDLMVREARFHQDRHEASTVFIGGGTPSVLPPDLLERLLADVVAPFLPGGQPVEWTIECNPESFSSDTARMLVRHGVNRISFGVQSFDAGELTGLGRRHDPARAIAAYREARDAGFQDVNLDLIYGFPGHTRSTWQRTLEQALALGPEHVSAYCFILEEGTPFHRMHLEGQLPAEDQDLQAELYQTCRSALSGAGLHQYEISNFSRPGRECRHNLRYWRNQTYVGLGLGAASFIDGRRRSNARTQADYRRQIEDGRTYEWIEDEVAPPARVRESLILGLRMLSGVELDHLAGGPLPEAQLAPIRRTLERWRSRGLLDGSGDRYALTDRGLFLSNEVFTDLV